MNRKPFNLEEAKAGKPIVTRDGIRAKFIAHVPECEEEQRVVALLEGDDGLSCFTEKGYYFSNKAYPELNLFMLEEKKEPVVRWLWAQKVKPSWYSPEPWFMTDEEKDQQYPNKDMVKLEWSRTEFTE